MIVTHLHMKSCGYCNSGGRAFATKHGLNWAEFVRNGISEDDLLRIDDEMARRLVEYARSHNSEVNNG